MAAIWTVILEKALPYLPAVLESLFEFAPSPAPVVIIRPDPEQARHVEWLTEMLLQQQSEFVRMHASMKKRHIDNFDDLQAHDAELAAAVIRLAQNVPALQLDTGSVNAGFFGLVATGKTSIINRLLGREAGICGPGEVTHTITEYRGAGRNLWDMPGASDSLRYFSVPFISCMKALSRRVIVVNSTLKESAALMNFFRALGLSMIIVVNRCDRVLDEGESEFAAFQAQIRKERDCLFPGTEVFFVAARRSRVSYAVLEQEWERLVGAL